MKEIARILRELADRVEAGERSGTLLDSNGKTAGRFQRARRRVKAGMIRAYTRGEFTVTICTDNAAFQGE